jgi:hypothetical protein
MMRFFSALKRLFFVFLFPIPVALLVGAVLVLLLQAFVSPMVLRTIFLGSFATVYFPIVHYIYKRGFYLGSNRLDL